MDTEVEGVAATAVIAIVVKRKKKNRKKRSAWVKPWLTRKTEFGAYSNLLNEFRIEDLIEYQKFLRISPEIFDEFLRKTKHRKERCSVSPSIKLAATISFWQQGRVILTYNIFFESTKVP